MNIQIKIKIKRDDNTFSNANVGRFNSFKYKFNLIGTRVLANNNINLTNTVAQTAIAGTIDTGRKVDNVKIVVPLKYLGNFFRSLEMPLVNCKIHVELEWSKNCVLSNVAGASTFIIRDTKLYVPVVTLSKEDNKDFNEQQNKSFQRYIYWNEYLIKENQEDAPVNNTCKTFNIDPSYQGVNPLFVIAFDVRDNRATRNGHERYYLPKIDISDYNAIID